MGPVGRADELERLTRLVRQVAQGRGGLAWVQGEAGAGSSTLIDELTAQAADCLVLRATADELAQAFPLRLLADVLESEEITRLLRGEIDGSGAVDPVLAAGERMLELVDRLCAERPVVLVTEDLQWADEPSLLVWGRLARSVGQIPLLLIGTAQPVPHRDTAARLRDLVDEVVELGPLTDQDIRTIAARILNAEPGPRLSAELARAGGNPLYARELVDSLVRDGLVENAEFIGESGAVPSSLAVAIGRRLQLPSADVLRVAALLGNDFDLTELAIASGRSVVELSGVVEHAITAGVLRASGERLRFRHELIRQVLVEQTSAATRVALHRHLAEQLATAGRGVDVVARHLLAVPDITDGWVRRWLSEVPDACLYAVPQVAAELLGRVLKSAGPSWEVLAARAARVAFWLGRDEDALRLAREVARRTADVELAARMNLLALRAAGRSGRMDEALAIAHEPVAEGVSDATRAALGAWSGVMLAGTGAVEEAGPVVDAAREDAERSGDPLALGYALHASALVAVAPIAVHRIDEALAVLGDGIHDSGSETMDLRLLLLNNRLTYLAGLGRWEETESVLVLAERAGTFRGASLLATAAEVAYKRGNWDDALVHLGGIDTAFVGNASNLNPPAIGALIALHRGEQAKAEEYLRATGGVDAWSARNPANWRLTAAWALQAEVDGDQQAALGLMTSWLDPAPVPGQRTRQEVLPHLVRLALAAGDRETAVTAAEVARADADADLQVGEAVAARCCEAQLNDDADGLLEVARDYERHGWPLQRALALEEAAVRLAPGDAGRAREAFVEALKIYADLGATWDQRRAEARLRAFGIRRGPRSLHRRATSGWEALTPAEVRIAGLVARGLSNPDIAAELFLSRRTVQTHVSNVLGKLGLSSRLEIVRAGDSIPTHAG
uniref:ATP-binding protein n=1 Tax=Lentzea alba TaxID=2714351 RepID=UPI0039BF242C